MDDGFNWPEVRRRLATGELRQVPYEPTAREIRREDIGLPWTYTACALQGLSVVVRDLFHILAALTLLPWRLVAPFRSGGAARHFAGDIDFVEVDEP